MGFFDNLVEAVQNTATTALKPWGGGSASPSSGLPKSSYGSAAMGRKRGTDGPMPFREVIDYNKRGIHGDEIDQEQEREADAKYVTQRTNTLGAEVNDNIERTIKQMSQEDYDSLSPQQRAAVDFNTLLTDAVASDKANQDPYKKVKGQARATYDAAVEEQFGKDRGSDIYAPETMAVLRQLNLDNTITDLDDYLGLKIAINEEDLKALAPQPNKPVSDLKPGLVPEQGNRADFQSQIASRTTALAETLAKGNQMLANFSTSAKLARGSDRTAFGGAAPSEALPLGFGTDKMDEYFKQAYTELATNPTAAQETLDILRTGLKPKELDAFWNYADQRSRSSLQYGTPLGTEEDLLEPGDTYTTPQDFRKLLGLD